MVICNSTSCSSECWWYWWLYATVHHAPRNAGGTGGGVGVLLNDIIKLVTLLETANNAVSFESMEITIKIISIYIYIYIYTTSCYLRNATL